MRSISLVMPVTLRSWPSVIVVASATSFVVVLPVAFAISLADPSPELFWGLFGGLWAAVWLACIVRIRCVVSDRGVVVVNLLRTYSVAWASIERVETAEAWFGAALVFSSFSPLRIRTSDGRKIIVQASFGDPERVERMLGSGSPRGVRGAR